MTTVGVVKPVHPRATQGIALIVLGVVVAVVAGVVVDDRVVAGVVAAVGGFVALAGVIIYAASPARVDWEPPGDFLDEWRRGHR